MSGPYRDSGDDQPVDGPRDEGIVGDVIAQFADIHAFYRELVQNSIDAGSPSIEVELDYNHESQRMSVSVKDRGEGMTRDIVENQLLVLFRSTKEKEKGKIGKFGIGFASVLAPNPEVVKVNTVRDKKRLMLHLYRDLSYELFDAGAATQNGTTVTLELAMKEGEVKAFVDQSRAALRRWCRHATVPIDFWETRSDGRAGETINSPLDLDLVSTKVRATTDDGQLTVVVGLGHTYVGFFNHGLMLYETTDPLVGNYSVKIQDARLGHTISRDDVRRDPPFYRAVEFAREVAKEKLGIEAARQLKEYADAGKIEDVLVLVSGAVEAGIELAEWHVPLVEPVHGAKTIDVAKVRKAWSSRESTGLTKELARLAHPVILAPAGEEFFADRLERATGVVVRDVHGELTGIKPVERTERDEALIATLSHILAEVYRDPGAVVLADLVGLHADRLSIAGQSGEAHFVDSDAAAKNPFALLSRRPLVLSVAHPLVQAARANGDPKLAAAHLARAVLLNHRLLDANRSQAILELALAHSGVALE